MGISVCIPAFNEEGTIEATVRSMNDVLGQIPGDHEIIVVNDGSRDRTGEIVEELKKELPRLRPQHHEVNRGNPNAQRTFVANARGDMFFYFGGDGSWPARELLKLIAAMDEGGFDIVIGVRKQRPEGAWRIFISRMFNGMMAVLFGFNFRDIGSIRLVRGMFWKNLPMRSNSAFLNAENLSLSHANGCRIGFAEVDYEKRAKGKSSFGGYKPAWRAFKDLVRYRFSSRPRQLIEGTPRWEREKSAGRPGAGS